MIRLVAVAVLLTTVSSYRTTEGWSSSSPTVTPWEREEIVPDAVDVAPSQKLSIVYDSGVEVNFGNVLTPTQVRNHPRFHWNADPRKFYTLVFMDLDVPSRADPSQAEFLHYLVGNIPGSDLFRGDVLADFMGSGPGQGSGLHRYVFLIFEQPGRLRFNEKLIRLRGGNLDDRIKFSTRNFVRKYRLGQPVAGNFYLAEWDETVPKLFAEWNALARLPPANY